MKISFSFLKVSAGGRKSRILMSMNVATELRDHLQTFDEHIRTLSRTKSIILDHLPFVFFFFTGEYNPTNVQSNEDGRLRSATITRDDRKYYLDLKENDRGRFLRVKKKRKSKFRFNSNSFSFRFLQISMVGPNAPRTQIALPVQGVQELRETLASLLDEFGNEDDKGLDERHLFEKVVSLFFFFKRIFRQYRIPVDDWYDEHSNDVSIKFSFSFFRTFRTSGEQISSCRK